MRAGEGAQRYAWRRWGDAGVVFDRRYGDTHTLSGATAQVFQAWLSTGSTAPDVLLDQIATSDQRPDLDAAALAEALQELQQRGLLPPPQD